MSCIKLDFVHFAEHVSKKNNEKNISAFDYNRQASLFQQWKHNTELIIFSEDIF